MEQLTRISHDIGIMGGKACIKGTRVTVGMLLTQLGGGKTVDELLDDYPYLSVDDIAQALKYNENKITPASVMKQQEKEKRHAGRA